MQENSYHAHVDWVGPAHVLTNKSHDAAQNVLLQLGAHDVLDALQSGYTLANVGELLQRRQEGVQVKLLLLMLLDGENYGGAGHIRVESGVEGKEAALPSA